MSENGHRPDAEDRLLESTIVWPPSWRLMPGDSAEVQARIRAKRLAELRERDDNNQFGDAA